MARLYTLLPREEFQRMKKRLLWTWVCLIALQIQIFGLGCGSDRKDPSSDVSSSGAYPDRGWPVIHHDNRNSDSMDTPGPRGVSPSFHVLQGKFIAATATVGPEGNVYVGVGLDLSGGPCRLFALDGSTGDVLWCSDRVNDAAIASSPTIDRDGNVYLGDNRAMYSFTSQGHHRWQTPIVGLPLSAQFTPEGHLFFITHICRIYVLSRDTGEPILDPYVLLPGLSYEPGFLDYLDCGSGSSEGNCPCANTPSIDLKSGVFYCTLSRPGKGQTSLVAMRYIPGDPPRIEPLWENQALAGGSASSPDLSGDGLRLYVNDNTNHMLALSAENDETLWSFDLGYNPLGSACTSRSGVILPTGGIGAPLVALRDAGDHAEILWERPDLESRGIAVQRGTDRAYVVAARAGNLLGIRLLVLDLATGRTLDEESVSATEFARWARPCPRSEGCTFRDFPGVSGDSSRTPADRISTPFDRPSPPC